MSPPAPNAPCAGHQQPAPRGQHSCNACGAGGLAVSQLTLPLGPHLRSVLVVAFGRRVVCRANGSAGAARLDLPIESYPPRQEPCRDCEHRERPECAVVEGCPEAEGWRAAQAAYAAAVGGSV